MALVQKSLTATENLLAAIAAAPAVAADLGGYVELPPLPASRSIDAPPNASAGGASAGAGAAATADDSAAAAGDGGTQDPSADFSASHWSTTLPRGYRLCRRRASCAYDADVQEFFEQYAQIEEE